MRFSILAFAATLLPALAMAKKQARTGVTHQVTVENFKFDPNTLNINVGDTVIWNFSQRSHNVVQGSMCQAGGLFTSGKPSSVSAFSFIFTKAGTFPYFCAPHCDSADMTGTVTVA